MPHRKLTQRERLLLYLRKRSVKSSEEGKIYAGREITQDGIAEALGTERKNIPRVIKPLIEEGYVKEWKARVNGYSHLRKVYTLTAKGILLAKEIEQRIHTEEYINTNM